MKKNELSFCHKLRFSYPHIFAFQCRRPQIFQTMNFDTSNNLNKHFKIYFYVFNHCKYTFYYQTKICESVKLSGYSSPIMLRKFDLLNCLVHSVVLVYKQITFSLQMSLYINMHSMVLIDFNVLIYILHILHTFIFMYVNRYV